MKLYQVKITAPVLFNTYFVLASGFDEAARMAIAADESTGGRCAGVQHIEIVGKVEDDEENLLISDAGITALGLS